MKIRTDFVTNSSSSSFVVEIDIYLEDGTELSINNHEVSGDFDAKGCSLKAKNATGNELVSIGCGVDEELPWEVSEAIELDVAPLNLSEISSATTLKSLISAITKPFGLDCHMAAESADDEEDDEEYEDEYEDEETAVIIEEIKSRFNAMVDNCTSLLETHLTKTSDLKDARISMEFSGRGEFLADQDEILQRIFGWSQKEEILVILSEDDEGDIIEKLKSLEYLKNFTEESLKALINFYKNCDCAPDECNIVQQLQSDGKIDLTISWE